MILEWFFGTGNGEVFEETVSEERILYRDTIHYTDGTHDSVEYHAKEFRDGWIVYKKIIGGQASVFAPGPVMNLAWEDTQIVPSSSVKNITCNSVQVDKFSEDVKYKNHNGNRIKIEDEE